MTVPASRIRVLHDAPENVHGTHVLYWMIAVRRPHANFALDRARELAAAHDRPLLVLEPLRCDYRWASDRLHAFVIQGMADNAAAFARAGIAYHAYVEPERGAGKGLLDALAKRACVVVTDDYPGFFLPHMLAAAASQVPVRFEAIDSNGLYPLRDTPRVFPSAHVFRRHLQKHLPSHLHDLPTQRLAPARRAPFEIPGVILRRWPAAKFDASLDALPIDHTVAPVALRGGHRAAEARMRAFLAGGLDAYAEGRNHPDDDASSGFSPWLHFGHLSPHAIFGALAKREAWSLRKLGKVTGSREGFWGMSPAAEAFLDELVTWRELGFNFTSHRDDWHELTSLPAWAQATLRAHAHDAREPHYDLETLAAARTHDEVWNAAQNQLLREGRIHNYLRMLWGKNVIAWSKTPHEALEKLVALNDRYAIDGRDPNSYSGIMWCFGRYDRPWGPERKVFGTVRYMSSANTLRKLRMKKYLAKFST